MVDRRSFRAGTGALGLASAARGGGWREAVGLHVDLPETGGAGFVPLVRIDGREPV